MRNELLALGLASISLGFKTVVDKAGLLEVRGLHPVLFGMLRVVVTTALLGSAWVCCATCSCGTRAASAAPMRHLVRSDGALFVVMGCCLFCSEFFLGVGFRMAGFFTNALWQPSQPVFAMMLAVLVGIERLTIVRALGVAVTVTGSILMAFGEPRDGSITR